MSLPGITLSSFQDLVPATATARHPLPDKWELMDYTNTQGAGTMLLARSGVTPPPVVIAPHLKGWRRIFVCLTSSSFPSPVISLKLTKELGATIFCKCLPNNAFPGWTASEHGEEYYWECADLTDQEITLTKMTDSSPHAIGLLWLRFEPMTSDEIQKYQADAARRDVKKLHTHTDLDFLELQPEINEHVFDGLVQNVSQADVSLLSVEFYPLLNDYSYFQTLNQENADFLITRRTRNQGKFCAVAMEAYQRLVTEAHTRNISLSAAMRISMGELPYPYDYASISHMDFGHKHPEFYCLDRDGEKISVLSYAFPQVQDYMIGEFLKMIELGFDGVTLFFHRGLFTLFEEPVLQLAKRLYPDLDARLLPLDDPRLVRVHCDLLTGFITKLRNALDEFSKSHNRGHLEITIAGNYSLADNLRLGVDAARWAREKLIDNLLVENMRTWETADNYRDAKNPDLIDMALFKKAKYESPMPLIRRRFANDLQEMLKNCPEFVKLSKETGLAVYFDLPWENTQSPETLRDYALQLYQAGAEHISLWDGYHVRVMNHAEWNIVSRLGHIQELANMPADREGYGTHLRMLSYNGNSIAAFNPAWRG